MSTRLLRLLPLLALLTSCEDATSDLFPALPPVHLPAATQVGANTLGGLVNGQPWEASNSPTLDGRVLTPTARYAHGELRLEAFRRLQVEGPVASLRLVAARVTGPGVYPLAAPTAETGRTATLGSIGQPLIPATGTLTITRLDTTGPHPVVAGRFELHATAPAGQALRVSEGRFDVQLSR